MITTKTGDKGETSLMTRRIMKNEDRINAIGNIDELNAWLGTIEGHDETQRFLFDLGSELALETKYFPTDKDEFDFHLAEIESIIDSLEKELPELTDFILPKGKFQIIRAVCRRAERSVVGLAAVSEESLQYLNRLSDYFFLMARKECPDVKR